MSVERKVRPESYKKNRKRVFEIYNIDPKNKDYNCHHIVTKEDVKKGLVPPDFNINGLSNLIPMIIREHNELHKKIHLLEKEDVSQNITEEILLPIPEPIGICLVIANEERIWSLLKYKNRDEIFTRQELQEWQNSGVS